MYALYSPELLVLEHVRAALPPGESGIATTSWSEFEGLVQRSDCLLIASRWLSDDIRASLRVALSGASAIPLILITNKDADNARSALDTGATHIVWLGEVQRKLHALVCSTRVRGALNRAAELLEHSSRLPWPLGAALAYACRSEQPIRSVAQLAAVFSRDRRTLWRHWHRVNLATGSLRLEDFLHWVMVLRAARLKAASRSWAEVAEAIGTHEHTLARMVTRLAETSLTKLGESNREELEARFLQTVVRPLAIGDRCQDKVGSGETFRPCSARRSALSMDTPIQPFSRETRHVVAPSDRRRDLNMAPKKPRERPEPAGVVPPPPPAHGDSETTGRYIVLLREGAEESAVRLFHDRAGISAATIEGADDERAVAEGSAVFPHVGAAVLDADPEQFSALSALGTADEPGGNVILAAEPERFVYAIQELESRAARPFGTPLTPFIGADELELPSPMDRAVPRGPVSADYVRGYRDSIDHLAGRLLGPADTALPEAPEEIEAEVWNESEFTWGVQATNANRSRYSGRGVKVAVLDTGFGPHHDFAGRTIVIHSFVPGQAPADGHGHGTHCIGTACGPRRPRTGPRYGVAYESDILAGKVLSNQGSGQDGWILAGINWAVVNRAQIVSMSLGAAVAPGTPFSPVYEGVAQRALARGTMIIAAAGNDSQRPPIIRPVGRPANCPTILAVGAVDPTLGVSSFSNGGINPNGGEVNIAAPGRDVLSSWPMPPFYRRLAGTSMATPHVAGIAALFAQATGANGVVLWRHVARHARHLAAPTRDVGVGLVRAR